ncbi:hypothetical protein EGR_04604 [Echinococcus granulosus]|uniref:Uncharacterized protein n=1 Tax=Echinococcus granulosus TaxID=6210 RepID=W6UGF6_ECHGR|nr:hypothetical protein EGR_04604 [Echinococcus granulosus]EUB60585.1 hypothetical protein EGR_04604 [Echinococcus granulosus]
MTTSVVENRTAIAERFDKVKGISYRLKHYRTKIAFEIAERLNHRQSDSQTKGKLTLLAKSKAMKESELEPAESGMSFSGRRALSAAIYKSIRKQRSTPSEYAVTDAANSLVHTGDDVKEKIFTKCSRSPPYGTYVSFILCVDSPGRQSLAV